MNGRYKEPHASNPSVKLFMALKLMVADTIKTTSNQIYVHNLIAVLEYFLSNTEYFSYPGESQTFEAMRPKLRIILTNWGLSKGRVINA